MKKKYFSLLLCAGLIVLSGAVCSGEDQVMKKFAWNQSAADVVKPDFGGWKLYRSGTPGGPYELFNTVEYAGSQSLYTSEQSIDGVSGQIVTSYFVLCAFNKISGQVSGYSNEVVVELDFTNSFSIPFGLEILISGE